MNSRTTLNLGLMVILAGLVILTIYEPGKEKALEKPSLTSLSPSEIQTIVIEQPGQEKTVLQKTQKGWVLKQPIVTSANTALIKNILEIANAKCQSTYLASEVDLDQLKLDQPSLTLYLNDTRLVFGYTDALRGYRYILTENKVHLIIDRFSHLIRGKFTSLVSPSLLPVGTNINKLVLPELRLQNGENGWSTTPEQKQTSTDQIQQVIDEWRYARAMKVTLIADADSSIKMDKESSIQVFSAANETYSFNLYRTADEIILTRPDIGLRYHFEKQAGERLLTLPSKEKQSAKPN